MDNNENNSNDTSAHSDLIHKEHNIVVLEKSVDDGTGALAPKQFTGLHLGAPQKVAVGIPAITSSIQHAFKWMNPTDAVRTMLKMNQKGGFDCSHLIHGKTALILPCLGRTEIDTQASGEQFVTCENSMGVVQTSTGILTPCSSNLKSETAIVCDLAAATLKGKTRVEWSKMRDNYNNIRNLIEKVIAGFDDYNTRVQQAGGFYLPNGPRERKFTTADKKAHFTINPAPKWTLKNGEYMMMTIRTHDQFNTTIYGLDDPYRGVYNERRVVLMNQKDMITEGLKVNNVVDLYSDFNGVTRESKRYIIVPYDI
jgi:hypothetical protein